LTSTLSNHDRQRTAKSSRNQDAPAARSEGRDIVAVEAKDNALITEYLANNGVGNAGKLAKPSSI
jgi:hypothetical protein